MKNNISIPHVFGNDALICTLDDNNPVHIILDLETMGTRTDSMVISIGAVCMDSEFQITGYFYTPVRMSNLTDTKFSIDKETLNWWMQQPGEAKSALNLFEGICINSAAYNFCKWINAIDEHRRVTRTDAMLWGNGPEFDNIILRHMFNAEDITWPFKYNSSQSIRTLKLLNDTLNLGVTFREPFIKHHALYDAESEALFLRDVMQKLNI